MPRQQPVDRRRTLLAAAGRIAAVDGLDALSGPDVAAAAGISKALVFHYFGSVLGLRLAVLSSATDALLDVVGAPLSPGVRPTREDSFDLLDRVLAHMADTGPLWRSVMRGPVSGQAGAREVLDVARARIVARLLGVVARDDPATVLVVRGWVALFEEIAVSWLEDPTLDRADIARMLAECLHALVPLTAT